MPRSKTVSRVIPGTFTKEEMETAFASQDSGIPHPRIEDDHWARIQERWGTLPQVWGCGPWVSRQELMVQARTTSTSNARIYRVNPELWGLELWGTSKDDGIHRGSLDELLDRTLAAWPPAPPGAGQPTEEQQKAADAYRERKARTTHEATKTGVDWLVSPTVGLVAFSGLEALGGPCRVSWSGADEERAMSPAQARAARALVETGEQIRDALLRGVLENQRRFAAQHGLEGGASIDDLAKGVVVHEVELAEETDDEMAYTDFEYEDALTGLRNASMLGTRLVAVCELGEKRRAGVPTAPPAHRDPMSGPAWLEAPSAGPVRLPGLEGFQGLLHLTWETTSETREMTPAQERAARFLVSCGGELCDDLLDALFADQRDFAEDEAFPKAKTPSDLLDLVELKRVEILRREEGGIAYVDLHFEDAWRIEHGLSAVLHGARVVTVGGYGDTRLPALGVHRSTARQAAAPSRTADGARTAETWIEMPHDAKVAFPMWTGQRGRWDVRFVYEDEDEPALTSEQERAARLLLDEGDAIRRALLGRLLTSYRKSAGASPEIATPEKLSTIIAARALRIHAEDVDHVAYTEFVFFAPWRRFERARILMNGTRLVRLTTKHRVEEDIEADQEQRVRLARAKRRGGARRKRSQWPRSGFT